MPGCVVKACVNYHQKRTIGLDGITFHRFPTDPVRHEAWSRVIRNERREPYFKAKIHSVICSEHFNQDDFYSPGRKRILKKTAIPSVKVQPFEFPMEEKETLIVKIEPNESDDSLDHSDKYHSDSVKVKIEADVSDYNPHDGLNDPVILKIESLSSNNTQKDFNDIVEPHASDVINGLKRKIDKYTWMNEAKTKKIKVLQRQNNRLITRNKYLMKIIKELNSKGLISTEIKAALGDTPELAMIYKLL